MIIKDLDDYLDDICQKYPKVPRHEIKRLLEYGFNTFYTLNKRGADVVIYNRSFAAYCGKMFLDSFKRLYYYNLKKRIKLRLLYRFNQETYSGSYFFGLTDAEWEFYQMQIKNKRRSKLKFQDLLLYKNREESFIDKSKTHFFEVYYPIDVGWKFTKNEISTRNFRYIGYRDTKGKIVLI